MRGPSHVLSPTGEWVDFEYLDHPAAVDAVKALLDANIPSNTCAEGGSFPSTTEQVGPALRQQPGPVDDDLCGGVAVADSSHRSLAIAEPGISR